MYLKLFFFFYFFVVIFRLKELKDRNIRIFVWFQTMVRKFEICYDAKELGTVNFVVQILMVQFK